MLNQKASKFIFNFPLGFIYETVNEQFLEFVKAMPYNYEDSLSFLNSTIQGISFPGFEAQSVNQRLNREPVSWKNGIELHTAITKEVTVNFRLLDGMLNWFILLLNTEYFLQYPSNETFHPDFTIRVLDSRNIQIFAIKLIQPRMTALSEASLSYTNNGYDAKEFNATFSYNRYELRFEED